MDSLIAAAAHALAVGDAVEALKHVSLRDDPPALALRGIARAPLGEVSRARDLLRRAARGFGRHEARSRARCVVAEAEVALALRDLRGAPRALMAAADELDARSDHVNARHARLIAVRRALLLGRLSEADAILSALDPREVPPSLWALAELAVAELALRSLRTASARAALDRAAAAARQSRVPALQAEVTEAQAVLERPAARAIRAGQTRTLRLHEVEALFASGALVVDACRRGLRTSAVKVPLMRRPVLFTLVCALAEAWPGDLARDALIARAFRIRRPDETHRARLRVEIGRLRALIAPMARVEASARGFALTPHESQQAVVVLAPPVDSESGAVLALLADGAAWSTSALALAIGASQRTVQRALVELEATGQVRAIGRARARRWLAPPLAGFTTILLLPATLPLT